jgi:hypothetical protein
VQELYPLQRRRREQADNPAISRHVSKRAGFLFRSRLFEIARVLVHLDHLASFIVNPDEAPGDNHRNQTIPKRLEVL